MRPVSATVALRVFFQKVVEQFLTVVKIRALEPRQSIGKVEETALRRAREKAQGSGEAGGKAARLRKFTLVSYFSV